ncbi:MAG: RDD family protein [Bacteroidia bacterium]
MTDQIIITKPNLGKRITAGFIDYGIIFLLFFVLIYFFGVHTEDKGYTLTGLPAIGLMLFWFLYTIGAEQLFGATLGNYLENLEVISILDNQPSLTFGQSFKRHLLDLIDIWLFGVLAILFIKNTKYNQRLGDIWARTIVVDTMDQSQGFQ